MKYIYQQGSDTICLNQTKGGWLIFYLQGRGSSMTNMCFVPDPENVIEKETLIPVGFTLKETQ